MTTIDRNAVAARLFRLNQQGFGIGRLARELGTTIPTLDKVISYSGGRDSTYARLLPAIERLEAEVVSAKRSAT